MRIARLAAVVAIVAVAAGCAPGTEGPLRGPRVQPREVGICAPASDGANYFGEVVSNTGDHDITLRSVDLVASANVTEFEAGVDLAGPAMGVVVGAMQVPDEDPVADAQNRAILERLVPPEGAVVPAGVEASVLLTFAPEDPQQQASVDSLVIVYEADGREFREPVDISDVLVPGDTC